MDRSVSATKSSASICELVTIDTQERPLKVRRTLYAISIELPIAEAVVLFDELSHVRGGARLPKLKQVCRELEVAFTLEAQRKNSKAREEARLARRTKKQEIP